MINYGAVKHIQRRKIMTFLKFLVIYLVVAVVLGGCSYSLAETYRTALEFGYEVRVKVDEEAVMTASYLDRSITEPITVTVESSEVFLISVNEQVYDSDTNEDGDFFRKVSVNSEDVVTLVKSPSEATTFFFEGKRPIQVDVDHPFGSDNSMSGLFMVIGIILEAIWLIVMISIWLEEVL